jgi:hypothetical protein
MSKQHILREALDHGGQMRMGMNSTKSGLDLRLRICGSNPVEKVHRKMRVAFGPWRGLGAQTSTTLVARGSTDCRVPRDRVNILNGLIISEATDDQNHGLNDLVACPAVRL